MFRKIFVVCLVSFNGLVCSATTYCLADSQAALEQATQNVVSLIEAGDYAKADADTNQLIADCAGNAGIAEAVRQIAMKHHYAKNYQKTIELSRYIVTNCPKSDRAVWAQQAIAMANMLLGNDTAAMAETETLINVYKDDPNLPWALQILGSTYMTSEKYDMARGTLKEVIQKYPKSPYARKARLSLRSEEVFTLFNSLFTDGSYSAAQAALDKLLTDFRERADFAGFPSVPQIVITAAEKCYMDGIEKEGKGLTDQARERFERALKELNRIINKWPDSEFTPEAYCSAGDCYDRMGKYEESIRHFKKVVDSYPDYEYAWRAQFMIGQNYQKLTESGVIPQQDAEPLIIKAYERLVRDYESCPRAKDAWRELGHLHAENSRWTDTVRCYKAYLKLIDEVRCPPDVFYNLARAYDGIGDRDLAIKNYKTFLRSVMPGETRRSEAKARLAELQKVD